MASFVLHGAPFPDGTSVGAYDATGYSSFPAAGPPGTATVSVTAHERTVSFVGLANAKAYFAAGQVSGKWRYVRFMTSAASEPEAWEGAVLQEAVDRSAADELLVADLAAKQDASSAATDVELAALKTLFPFVSVVDPAFGAVGDGVADDTEAAQAALDAVSEAGCGTLIFPGGTNRYKIAGTLTKDTAGSVTVMGSGQGAAIIEQTVDADLFNFDLPETSTIVQFSSLRLVAGVDMSSGAAIKVKGTFSLPTVTTSDVFVYSEPGEWKYGAHLTDCAETRFDRFTAYGTGTKVQAIYITSAEQPSAVHKFVACAVYGAEYGLRVISATSPGVEGVQVYGCDFVNVKYGVHRVNSKAGYGAPQTSIIGGHINATDTAIHLEGVAQAVITGGLLYTAGSSQLIKIKDAAFVTIADNTFVANGGDPTGIYMEAPTGGTGTILIHDNIFNLKSGGAKYCIESAAHSINNVRIHDNHCPLPGAGFLSPGKIDSSWYVRDNTPIDAAEQTQIVAPVDEVDIGALRASTVVFSTPGGATTIKKLKERHVTETITLKCDSELVTLEHNAGILLKEAKNATFATGRIISLKRLDTSTWAEI